VFLISTNFSRSLSFLRQEKGVSQRIAAQDLGVSQALLSHYENGIREPGFSFLLRACNYYNVSSDFLLGRTLSRDGTVILDAESLLDSAKGREDQTISDNLALLSKRLVSNSVDLLFQLLAHTKNEDAIRAACNYLSTAVYTLFRHLYQAEGKNSQDIFSVPSQKFALSVSKIDMISSEMDYVESLSAHAKEKGIFPDLSNDALTKQYDSLYQSLLHIIHITGERINCQLTTRKDS
jgi:transcriptional regulator with XRE-family HTH domain